MHLVLINPSLFSPKEYKARFDKFLDWVKKGNMYVYPFEPPLGLASIKAALENGGFKAAIIDQQGYTMERSELMERLKSCRPRVVGLTCMTSTFPVVRELAAVIKKELPETLVIAGGVHPTVCPGETLRDSAIDVVFRGESEITLQKFLAAFPGGPWQETPGIGYMENGDLVLTEMPLQVKDIDRLPMPDYHSFPTPNYMEYNSHLRGIKGISMLVSRGCPYECAFCAVKATMGRGWRARSPENVVAEMKKLHKQFGIEGVWFKDSIFNMKKAWFLEFCERLLAEKLPVTWQFNTRVDLLDEESLALAKKAGLTQIDLGIESGSPRILERLKKNTTVDQIISGIKLVKKHVRVSGFFMIGTPGETMEDIEMTFNLAKTLDLDCCSWSIYNPLPGSELYDRLAAEGRLSRRNISEEVHFTRVPVSFCEVPVQELNDKYEEINGYFAV